MDAMDKAIVEYNDELGGPGARCEHCGRLLDEPDAGGTASTPHPGAAGDGGRALNTYRQDESATCDADGALLAPFPWFGGKRKVAGEVWKRFGEVENYVEPFFGSGAVLLGRPTPFDGTETINDADGLVSNFWRSVAHDPASVAIHADWPVNENDLHARHIWLLGQLPTLAARLDADPDWHDAKVAGWWVWGLCAWIGAGWCSGNGPWMAVDGLLVKCDAGRGINRQLPHLGDAGRGINRQRPLLGDAGWGIRDYMDSLSRRLRRVRVCCGDWARVCGTSVTDHHGLTGVFFDPPYSADAKRDSNLYRCDSLDIAASVRQWCLDNGDNPLLRIALCGYEGEGHELLESAGWSVFTWNAGAGYAAQGGNHQGRRERIWFSPACLNPDAMDLPLFANVTTGEGA